MRAALPTRLAVLLLAATAAAVAGPEAPADAIYRNGRIYTANAHE